MIAKSVTDVGDEQVTMPQFLVMAASLGVVMAWSAYEVFWRIPAKTRTENDAWVQRLVDAGNWDDEDET